MSTAHDKTSVDNVFTVLWGVGQIQRGAHTLITRGAIEIRRRFESGRVFPFSARRRTDGRGQICIRSGLIESFWRPEGSKNDIWDERYVDY